MDTTGSGTLLLALAKLRKADRDLALATCSAIIPIPPFRRAPRRPP